MKKITKISQQVKNKERVSVFLDDEFAFGLAYVTGAMAHLKVGMELTQAQIDELLAKDAIEISKQIAYRLLARRPYSVYEVRRHLKKKEMEEDTIDQAIGRLVELDLLNDEEFARYYVNQRTTFKPRGQRALQQELRQKGISRDIIDQAIAEVDELAGARKAIEKKAARWATLPKLEFRKKVTAHLARRGFPYDIIRQITDELWAELAPESLT